MRPRGQPADTERDVEADGAGRVDRRPRRQEPVGVQRMIEPLPKLLFDGAHGQINGLAALVGRFLFLVALARHVNLDAPCNRVIAKT
jgi:hypothetical protein